MTAFRRAPQNRTAEVSSARALGVVGDILGLVLLGLVVSPGAAAV